MVMSPATLLAAPLSAEQMHAIGRRQRIAARPSLQCALPPPLANDCIK